MNVQSSHHYIHTQDNVNLYTCKIAYKLAMQPVCMNTWQYNSTWSPPERETQSVGLTERDTECGTHRERHRVWDSQRETQSVGLAERDTECGTRRERYRVWDSQREIQSVGLAERDTECGTRRERYRVWDSQREIQSVGLTERDTECGTLLQCIHTHSPVCSLLVEYQFYFPSLETYLPNGRVPTN